ncbi:unnamed protein product [Calypogeia fissa]
MAEDCEAHKGLGHGGGNGQPVCLNWAGCGMFGGDLLDLDEADSELVDSKLLSIGGSPEDAKGNLFRDIKVNRPRNMNGNRFLESPMDRSPEYPPTLLELEVQALAKIGIVKLYHDGSDLEREAAKAEEDRRLAIINRFDRDRNALSPIPGQRPQPVKMVSNSGAQISGGSDLLELQKVALSSMKGVQNSSAAGGSDLLELQKVALSSMKKPAQTLASPSNGGPPGRDHRTAPAQSSGPAAGSPPNAGGELLELQKVALASMKKLSEILESQASTPTSGPMAQSTAGGDLLKLQRVALGNIMQMYQSEPSLASALSALQTTAPATKSPQHDGGSDLLELQKVALRSLQSISTSPPSAPALELQKVAPNSNQGASAALPAVVSQQAGGGDLLELQKLALRSIQNQTTPSGAPRFPEMGADFQDLRKKNLPSIPRQTSPVRVRQQGGEGGNMLERQKEALSKMNNGKGERVKEEQQFNTQGGGGTSSSSPSVFNKMPAREHLEMLLQELSSKDKALQSASRTIEEKDQLLQEYEASLANALNLMQCMNVRCTDAKEETAKVLNEAEEIFGNLREACSAVELFDCSIPQCAKGIHSLEEGPSTAAPPDDSHFFFGTGNGLETNHGEIDERRKLVEELLMELGNIEVARKEAQQGFELQIQRNEELIAELQQLDIAHDPVVEEATSDGGKNSSDQTDHALGDPPDQTKGPQSDLVHENPSDQKKGEICDSVSGISTDQAKENLSDHVNKISTQQAKEIQCDLAGSQQAKEIQCDLAGEIPCAHVYGNPCDHVYESPSDQAKKTLCDHDVFKNSPAHPHENSCDHACEKPDDNPNENQLCHNVTENPQDLSNENQSALSRDESSVPQANQNPCDPSYEQTNQSPCDHDFESASDLASESPTENTFESAQDLDRGDGKDSGHLLEEAEIESTSPSLAESNKQLADSFEEVETKVAEEIQCMKGAQPRKRSNPVARVSSPNALWEHLQHFVKEKPPQASDVKKFEFSQLKGDLDSKTRELQSQLEHRTYEVSLLHTQINEMRNALLQEQENRKLLSQKALDIHPSPTMADLEQKDKVIRRIHFQMHQLEAALRQEREENREALAQQTNESALVLAAKADMDNLRANLHSKDENIREMHEKIARKEIAWQTEKHQMMKSIDDLETILLVKEEEVINLAHDLEIARSSKFSQRPDELRFQGDPDVHFFQKQGKEEGREILDLRCEVLSLQDCLGIKTQAIKTMEKELARSYSIVTDLRSKLRGLQENERSSHRKGHTTELIERLKTTEEKLQRSESERAQTMTKIQDLSARCKYYEEFEHLRREGSDDKKEQAIRDLEKELERNVQIIKTLQARCNEFEAMGKREDPRNNFDPPGRPLWEQPDHTKLVQVREEKEALASECDQLRLQMKRYQEENERKGKLLDQLQTLRNRQTPIPPVMYQQNDGEPKTNAKTNTTQPTGSVLDLSTVESADVNTLRELLRGQWRVQKVMEDRLNSMMAYVSDRVAEFEREPSDTTSNSSLPATTELNHFHVEAKLMKLQLERQLQVLRGTTFTSLPASGLASPGQFPHSNISTQNLQLLVEKNALEDSAQTLQEKTSRLLNRLTSMRTEFNSQ